MAAPGYVNASGPLRSSRAAARTRQIVDRICAQHGACRRAPGIALRKRDNPNPVDNSVEKMLRFCARRPALYTENCRFPRFSDLLALTFRATLSLHTRVLGGRKRRDGLADFVRRADARRGSPGAVIRSRWGVCPSSRSDGSARQRLPPAGRRCRFGRHQVPLRIIGLSAGASTLPARDGCTEGRRDPSGSRARRNPRGSFGLIARVRQASPVSIGACPVGSPGRPRRTGRRREARPPGCGAGAPPEASRAAVPPSEVGLRFLRGPTSAPLPLSGSPGPIAGA